MDDIDGGEDEMSGDTLERALAGVEKAIELIQRWGCECEPRIGFLCGPCRVVEILDDAMHSARETGGERD